MEESKIRFSTLEQDVIWITRDGRTLRLEDMDPTHRKNTLRLLERKKIQFNMIAFSRDFGGYGPNGEVAQWCFEREVDEFIKQGIDNWFTKLPLICRLRELIAKDDERVRQLALKSALQQTVATAGPVVRPKGLRRA